MRKFIKLWLIVITISLLTTLIYFYKFYLSKIENDKLFVIIPHHNLVNNSIDEYYKYLRKKYWNFQNIIIISPNHFLRTKEAYISFPNNKELCYKNEKNCVKWNNFSFYNWSIYDDEVFNKNIINEHWIWNHFEFIKKYFKNTKVFSILLNIQRWETQDLKKLEKVIKDYKLNWKTLYIASVDFSHHVNEKIAIFHDLKTINFLNWVWNEIEVDCPNCLYFIRSLANNNWEKYFNLKNRTSTDTQINWNSNYNNTSHIYWEFSNIKEKDFVIQDKFKYSKFQNKEVWNKSEVFWIFFWDTHFTRNFTNKENSLKIDDYLKCFYQNKDKDKKPEFWHNRILYSFDFAWFNLETSVNENKCDLSKKEVNLITSPEYLKYFKEVWFNTINIANNHTKDCWNIWYEETKNSLKNNNIEFFWNESILKKEINGTKVAFLWIDDSTWDGIFENEIKDIKNLKKEWYLVILNLHWWIEYKTEVTNRQKKLAHKFIDNWVNLIIWHHPHVVQGYEIYKWVPIFYSLWNFIFDQNFEKTLKWQAVVFWLNWEWIKFNTINFTKNESSFEINCNSLE